MRKLKFIIIPILCVELFAAGYIIYKRLPAQLPQEQPSVEQPGLEEEVIPEPEIIPVILGGDEFSPDTGELTLNASVSAAELKSTMGEFAALSRIDASLCGFSDDEKRSLISEYPGVEFVWNVEVAGEEYLNNAASIELDASKTDALIEKADLLAGIETVSLTGKEFTPEEAAAVKEAFPGAVIDCTLSFFEQSFSSLEEELDFTKRKTSLDETERFKQLVAVMPNLKKVIMSDCGLSNEEMDALNKSYEDVRFVWMLHFKVYSLRTDATYFCVSDLQLPQYNYVCCPMEYKDYECIKYCTDLEALDLGHENIPTLEFVYNMPKLKFLIVITAHNKLDLTPVASLKDLYYFEVFNNDVEDLSPLLECKNLRHLNIGYCRGGVSLDTLKQMTWLDRLWFPGNKLTEEQKQELETALPNTECYLRPNGESGSTGGGWRETEPYRELRRALHMPYTEADGTQVKFRD